MRKQFNILFTLRQTVTTMTSGKYRKRITLITSNPKTIIAVALSLVLIVGCAMGCTFTGAPEKSSDPALTADTLQERLMDIPEDLREQVTYSLISEAPSHLADYWFNIPDGWTDMELLGGYLMSVYRFSWEEFMTDLSLTTAGRDLFARSDDAYFVIAWSDDVNYPPGQEEAHHSVYQAIRAYAMEQVLSTEGVEPFGLEQMLTADTLQERLLAVPEYLSPTVKTSASKNKWAANDIALVSYWWDVPAEWESERSPWLLDVHRLERNGIGSYYDWQTCYDDCVTDLIAQDEEFYYVVERPVDARFEAEDSEAFTAAYQAIRDYAERQVLLTQGVESFTPDLPLSIHLQRHRQPSVEPPQSSANRNIIINWDNVVVNESEDVAPRATRCPVDPSLYDTESWGEDEIVSYYGWNLAPAYIPDDLAGGNKPWGFMCKEKATGKIVEDEGGRRFLVDGATKSNDKGFTIYASKSGILHCYLLPVDEEQTTNFGGVPVTLSHASVPYGPFDPERMDPSGLYHLPAGYYDAYEASFTINGVEYEIEAQRLELEEVVKIAASIINVPYSENFTVGNPQNLPDKNNAPAEP